MIENLTAVAANYRRAGIRLFLLAYFVRTPEEAGQLRRALGLPVRIVRLTASPGDIRQRLATDVTSGRRDDLREAEASIASGEGAGIEGAVVSNDRPIGIVARDVLAFLGWPGA